MNDIIKYTEDKKFIRWVLSPDENINSYWEQYIKNNPDELENIEQAKIIVSQFKTEKEAISENETNELFSGIMKGVEEANKNRSKHLIAMPVFKYAAAILVLVSLGIAYYFTLIQTNFYSTAQKAVAQSLSEPSVSQLILCDGTVININEKNSFLEYINDKHIVVNQKDTIAIKEVDKKGVNHLAIARGNTTIIKLNDGTVIHVNSESHLVYPAVNADNTRQAYLEGEGFFEVAHNPDKPFVTSTSEVDIEVLGTKFNLSSYPSENITETFLVEGKVKVKRNDGLFSTNEEILSPNQKAIYNKKNKEINVLEIEDNDYITWYKGYLNFRSQNLSDIIKKLERFYNIKIQLENPELGKEVISGKLKLQEEEMDTVIKVLANTATLHMDKLEGALYILK